MKRFLVCCLTAALLMSGGAGVFAAPPGSDHGLKPVPGSFFVTLEARADRPALRGLVRAMGGTVKYEYELTPNRLNVRGLPPGAEVALARAAGVVSVSPDFEVHAHVDVSNPLIGNEPVVAGTNGGAGSIVCVLDSGIRETHIQFDDVPSRVVAWKDFVNGLGTPYDDNDHGSNVAAIVGGREGLTLGAGPLHGVAPAATLYIGKVLDSAGSGAFSDVHAGIDWCSGLAGDSPTPRADVINMSLGGGAFATVCDTNDTTGTAPFVNAAAAAGVLVVTSSGNEGNANAVGTPACASGAMAIGAVYDEDVGRQRFRGTCNDRSTAADQIVCFSNQWDDLDVAAPGCFIWGAAGDSDTGVNGFCGTSQASPHVAGLAALVLAANPTFSAADLRNCINSTAVDLGAAGFDRAYGNGRIDAPAAVACGGGGCTVTETPEVSCSDGQDNDCDGLTDGDDSDCAPTCTVTETPEVSCSDGQDNDCDGLTDGDDSDCAPTCTVTETPEVSCSDGQDNDCDGLTDGADPDCAPVCNLAPVGASCVVDADCCSDKCKGRNGAKTCK